MVGLKLERGKDWKNFNNVVNVFNDMKDFCCLDLKCSVMSYFAIFCEICTVFAD